MRRSRKRPESRLFLVLNRGRPMVLLQRKLGSRVGPTFSRGGVQLFPGGGVQILISIETHITCDFPRGVRTPYPSRWIPTWTLSDMS